VFSGGPAGTPSTNALSGAEQYAGLCSAASSLAGAATQLRAVILHPAVTTWHRVASISSNATLDASVRYLEKIELTWKNTSNALNRLVLIPDNYPTHNFVTGSWMRVVGYK
jgi:hypothetical protein